MKKIFAPHTESPRSWCCFSNRRLLITALSGLSFFGTFSKPGLVAQEIAQERNETESFTVGVGEHVTWPTDSRGELAPALPKEQSFIKITPSQGDFSEPTAPTGGLSIIPTFDSSIINDPNSAAIQATINQAIAIYQSLFTDPITVRILFRYSTTQPNGSPMGSAIARSSFVYYPVPWSSYINALIGDARTSNDSTANSTLPGSALSTNINPSSAGGRAVGLDTPGVMDPSGGVGSGNLDGIVTINSGQPFQFTRPPSANNYDALRSTQHEMDEVLGLGSHLNSGNSNLRPQDLFSWSSPGVRNTSSSGTRYFSINNGNNDIVEFNQDPGGDFGDWISPNCPQPDPFVQNAFSCRGQFSDVAASSPEGVNLDVIGYNLSAVGPTPTPSGSSVFANISTRLSIGTDANVLIGGFIVGGTQPKRVILRAIGPSLTIPGRINDTVLQLYNTTGGLIAQNDDWRTDQEAQIIATGIPPTDDFESAIVITLPANNTAYTAVVSGYNNATGVGLVEAYDLDRSVDSKLANISTRGFVTSGVNVMIGGTIIVGSNPTRVILRALGPTLTVAGVPNAITDPTLELHDSNGTVIGYNDDWRSSQEAEIIATGLAPTYNLESAMVGDLLPGSYTAVVQGFNNATGVALVELYQLQ